MISMVRRSLFIWLIAATVILSGVSLCMAETADPYDEPEELITDTMELSVCADDDMELENDGDDTSTSGSNKIVKVKSVKYDPENNVVTFKFNMLVSYKKTKAVIKYKDGKNLVTKIKKYGPYYLKVKVKKLKYGRKYSYKLTGIRKLGYMSPVTLTGTFRAIDK